MIASSADGEIASSAAGGNESRDDPTVSSRVMNNPRTPERTLAAWTFPWHRSAPATCEAS